MFKKTFSWFVVFVSFVMGFVVEVLGIGIAAKWDQIHGTGYLHSPVVAVVVILLAVITGLATMAALAYEAPRSYRRY